MKIGEKFNPHPNLKKIYYLHLTPIAVIMLLATLLLIVATYTFDPVAYQMAGLYIYIPFVIVVIVLGFVSYWIPKYYESISFLITHDEIIVERGVWWKMKHTVPHARVMSVDTIQGPISRHFGIGCTDIHTAGYTGRAGGTGGPSGRRAEASIWGIQNFLEVRETILNFVRKKPLFAAPTGDVNQEMLNELIEIRKILEKRTESSVT